VRTLLVVDGANVVGADPAGEWWKDRAGAATRLHERLMTGDTTYDEIVLVLEGQAKQGVRAGKDAHLRTVHAPGNGDDTIVREARLGVEKGRTVGVVTADRRLKDRVHAVGATTLRPTWLLERL
jgi:predicted RNA-binding protein with PIN domain